LMGALGVWLGGSLTVQVLIASLCVIIVALLSRKIRDAFNKDPDSSAQSAPLAASLESRFRKSELPAGRRLMTFAGPVAIATWTVLLFAVFVSSKGKMSEGVSALGVSTLLVQPDPMSSPVSGFHQPGFHQH